VRSTSYGFSSSSTGFAAPFRTVAARTERLAQADSLVKLVQMAQRASVHPLIRETAKLIVRDCASRDDMCELEAVFNAVKYGDPGVAPLRHGFKYIADPRWADYFTSPVDLLNSCLRGGCGGDCDDHTMLIMALCGALGFRMGARAWGRDSKGFAHVYAVAAYPKRPPAQKVIGMDTTVDESYLGWEPPKANVLTGWME
jgi:transglutaminase-like putative cysteine protease